MRGVGEAYGAITLVNALPTGRGAAAAVELTSTAIATLRPAQDPTEPSIQIAAEQWSPLVEAAAHRALSEFPPPSTSTLTLEIQSGIPVARGLKSSSAVSSALVAAVARASGHRVDAPTVARLSADVSQGIGLSATGAFDDAFASIAGGCALTDNPTRTVLARPHLPDDIEVILWIPRATHGPSVEWHERFRARREEGQAAVDAALEGDLWEAMERNTALVEDVMGYRYAALRDSLREAGAVASGVSGLGPTLATLVPRGAARPVLDLLPRESTEIRTVRFARPRTDEEAVA